MTSGTVDIFAWVSVNLLVWGSAGLVVFRLVSNKKNRRRITSTNITNLTTQPTPTSEITQRPINQVKNTTGFGFSSTTTTQSPHNSVPSPAKHQNTGDLIGTILNPNISIFEQDEDAESIAIRTHLEQLERAVSMFQQGLLTEKEFGMLKTRILKT